MKKNDYILLIATATYSFLFYNQNAGINYIVFNLILQLLLIIKDKNLLKNKKWLWVSFMSITSALAVYINSSALSIIANVVCLLLLSACSFNASTSSIFGFLFSSYSVVLSFIFVIIDALKRHQTILYKNSENKNYKIVSFAVVVLVGILFLNIYKISNPLFAENTKWINLDFISFGWVVFMLSGFLLMYSFLYHRVINPIEAWENSLPLTIQPSKVESDKKRLETEQYTGFLLFIVLNLMLVILNIGDIQTLYFNGGLPKNVTHSDFVHNGVGITILSILMATALIMYLFRQEFNKIKLNKLLMLLVYVWIFQNIVMLSSTVFRNQIYVYVFDLTYKRVGVYIWLLLAVLGLCIMFWKIYKKKSNWYLIKTNVALWFLVLVISGCFNWDKIITSYNIHNKPLTKVDFNYLFSLSDANIPELIDISKDPNFHLIQFKTNYHAQNYQQQLSQKIEHYLSDYTSDWRSFDYRDKQITESIMLR